MKKQFLLDTFPDLKEGNIGDSRSTSFEGLICNATAGQGVDLVLNSLSDDKLQAGNWNLNRELPCSDKSFTC